MDHPFYVTIVLTVIADHTLLVPKTDKKTANQQQDQPKPKPKPNAFLKHDYNQHLQEMVELLSKQFVFMSRRPRQEGESKLKIPKSRKLNESSQNFESQNNPILLLPKITHHNADFFSVCKLRVN